MAVNTVDLVDVKNVHPWVLASPRSSAAQPSQACGLLCVPAAVKCTDFPVKQRLAKGSLFTPSTRS